jgi:hypothetical protein
MLRPENCVVHPYLLEGVTGRRLTEVVTKARKDNVAILRLDEQRYAVLWTASCTTSARKRNATGAPSSWRRRTIEQPRTEHWRDWGVYRADDLDTASEIL